MLANHSPSPTAQWFREYWRQTRRPLASLAFILPLLVLYEGGVVLLGSQAVRNGADVWLRQLLDQLGLGQYFVLPAMTVAVLLAWHHITRDRWQLSASVLYAMFAECAVLGLLLLGVGKLQGELAQMLPGSRAIAEQMFAAVALPWGAASIVGRLLGFVGAGVYEEMLFRLLLLPPVSVCAQRFGAQRGLRIGLAVVLTSVVFSAAHYLGPHGEAFDAFTFWFRFTAGGFFALLFVYRGFGIAAGTHTLYDIFVSLG